MSLSLGYPKIHDVLLISLSFSRAHSCARVLFFPRSLPFLLWHSVRQSCYKYSNHRRSRVQISFQARCTCLHNRLFDLVIKPSLLVPSLKDHHPLSRCARRPDQRSARDKLRLLRTEKDRENKCNRLTNKPKANFQKLFSSNRKTRRQADRIVLGFPCHGRDVGGCGLINGRRAVACRAEGRQRERGQACFAELECWGSHVLITRRVVPACRPPRAGDSAAKAHTSRAPCVAT